MLTINKYDNTVAFVVVPKDATKFKICNGPNYWVTYMHNKHVPEGGKIELEDFGPLIPLPPGKWEILFRDSEANVKDLEKVIGQGVPYYQKYEKPGVFVPGGFTAITRYAQDSFESLLSAHSIQLTEHQDLLILKKVEK